MRWRAKPLICFWLSRQGPAQRQKLSELTGTRTTTETVRADRDPDNDRNCQSRQGPGQRQKLSELTGTRTTTETVRADRDPDNDRNCQS